eukprot:9498210-Pyramimonas_sp.AAC.1
MYSLVAEPGHSGDQRCGRCLAAPAVQSPGGTWETPGGTREAWGDLRAGPVKSPQERRLRLRGLGPAPEDTPT